MRVPFVNNTVAIILAIGVIVLSTAVLSLVNYHYTVGRENLAENSLVQSNIKLALHYVDLIEQRMVENDRILLDMIDIDKSSEWPSMVEKIKDSDLNVDQVYFLRPDSNYPLFPIYSYEIRNQWEAFGANFDVKELNIESLNLNQPHHLHKARAGDYFFASYVLKENREGERILVCYQMNIGRITQLLSRHLHDLQDRFFVSIVDYDNNEVYGQPISRSSKYFFETRFPTTFYKWILQIVPRNYAELELGMINQRRANLFFIFLSMSLVFVSLAVIYVGWRRDRQLRQLKESFIGNVSHELKTPLSLIRMFSEILVMGRVKSEDKKLEYCRIIHNESDRMSRLINNLLDFANLTQGIESKHFEKNNIAEIVTKTLEAYRYEIQQHGYQLNFETTPGIPDSFVDSNAITMAFLNLLDNSVKYSRDRKQIDVRIAQTDGYVDLSVSDKGVGIPTGEHHKIFEKFYRGSDPQVRRVRGSGIGLAITKYVAEMHGGEVLVESEPGKGSMFTLRIPIRRMGQDRSAGDNRGSEVSE